MDVQAVSSLIRCAKEHEQQNQHLFTLVSTQQSELHPSIELPCNNGSETLMKFIQEYVDHIPNFLGALESASSELSIAPLIQPFLRIIEENFMAPILQSRTDVGLYEILEKSYFTHRLIEEVNDAYQAKTGGILIPIDMTWPNLIAHEILGEEFGNELDSIVAQTVDHVMRSQEAFKTEKLNLYVERKDLEVWIETWSKWHCFNHQMRAEF